MENESGIDSIIKELKTHTPYQIGNKSFMVAKPGNAEEIVFDIYRNHSTEPGSYDFDTVTSYSSREPKDIASVKGTIEAAIHEGIVLNPQDRELIKAFNISESPCALSKDIIEKLCALPTFSGLRNEKESTPGVFLSFAFSNNTRQDILVLVKDKDDKEKIYQFDGISQQWKDFKGDATCVTTFGFADKQELAEYITIFKHKSGISARNTRPLLDVMFSSQFMPDREFQGHIEKFKQSPSVSTLVIPAADYAENQLNIHITHTGAIDHAEAPNALRNTREEAQPFPMQRVIVTLGAVLAGGLALNFLSGDKSQKTPEQDRSWVQKLAAPVAIGVSIAGIALAAKMGSQPQR